MSNYVKLDTDPYPDGTVDFIVNKTKKNYINLGGANTKETIDCVCTFMCDNELWDDDDCVIHTKKPISYVPDPSAYHDISPVLRFYNMGRLAIEARNKQNLEKISPIGTNSIGKDPIKESIIQNNNNNAECCVCLEIISEKYVLVPCGHVRTCRICIPHLKTNQCPICRKNFYSYIPIFE
jgi:hypothetical protein